MHTRTSFLKNVLLYLVYLNNSLNSFFFLAPGSYDVEKSEKIIHQSSGAVTFGIKYKEQKPDDIPGSFLHILNLMCHSYVIIRYFSHIN